MAVTIVQFPQKRNIETINEELMRLYFEGGRSVASIARDYRRSVRGLEILIDKEMEKGREVVFPT